MAHNECWPLILFSSFGSWTLNSCSIGHFDLVFHSPPGRGNLATSHGTESVLRLWQRAVNEWDGPCSTVDSKKGDSTSGWQAYLTKMSLFAGAVILNVTSDAKKFRWQFILFRSVFTFSCIFCWTEFSSASISVAQPTFFLGFLIFIWQKHSNHHSFIINGNILDYLGCNYVKRLQYSLILFPCKCVSMCIF